MSDIDHRLREAYYAAFRMGGKAPTSCYLGRTEHDELKAWGCQLPFLMPCPVGRMKWQGCEVYEVDAERHLKFAL